MASKRCKRYAGGKGLLVAVKPAWGSGQRNLLKVLLCAQFFSVWGDAVVSS